MKVIFSRQFYHAAAMFHPPPPPPLFFRQPMYRHAIVLLLFLNISGPPCTVVSRKYLGQLQDIEHNEFCILYDRNSGNDFG